MKSICKSVEAGKEGGKGWEKKNKITSMSAEKLLIFRFCRTIKKSSFLRRDIVPSVIRVISVLNRFCVSEGKG